jgi:hypothetical protein
MTNKKDRLPKEVADLLLQAVETELGGVEVYRTALKCAQNPDLRQEWTRYLEQTEEHVRVLQELCESLGIDPDEETPSRATVRCIGKSLVQAMLLSLGNDSPAAIELVAAECVTHAETKDHLNWSLLADVGKGVGKYAQAIAAACDQVEPQEDEHLYHTEGWARELWLAHLGLPAQLPPPEEEEDVRSELEAATVRSQRHTAMEKEGA